MQAAKREKVFSRDFLQVSLATGAVFASYYLLVPTLPLYVKSLGGSEAEVGLVTGVFTVASVVGRILIGPCLDLWGRKAFYVAGSIASLLATLSYVFGPEVGSLLLLRALHGLCFGVVTTAAGTLITDLSPIRRRGEAISYYGMFSVGAMSLGPAIGIALIGASGLPLQSYTLAFSVATVFSMVALVLALPVRDPHLHQQGSGTARFAIDMFFSVAALPPALAFFFITMSYGAIVSFLPLYATGENASNVAIYFFAYALVVFVLRPFAGITADRLGRRVVVIPAIAIAAVGVSLLAISPAPMVVVATAIIYGVGYGSLYPGIMALMVDIVPQKQRGAAVAMFFAALDSGIAFGAIVLGLVAQFGGFRATFLAASVCCAIGLLLFVSFCGRRIQGATR